MGTSEYIFLKLTVTPKWEVESPLHSRCCLPANVAALWTSVPTADFSPIVQLYKCNQVVWIISLNIAFVELHRTLCIIMPSVFSVVALSSVVWVQCRLVMLLMNTGCFPWEDTTGAVGVRFQVALLLLLNTCMPVCRADLEVQEMFCL